MNCNLKYNSESYVGVKQDFDQLVLTGLPVAGQKLTIFSLICATWLIDSETLVTINRTEVGRWSFDITILGYVP